ncbi:IS3 family transposase [Peribacillus butanolivorans]
MTYYNNFRYQWNLKKMTPIKYRKSSSLCCMLIDYCYSFWLRLTF